MYYTTLASGALAVWRAIETYGLNAEAMFKEVGLDPEKLYKPNARYKDTNLYQLWKLAVHRTGDPSFGLTVAQSWHPTNAHALGFSWLASTTLLDALQRLERYIRVLSDKNNVSVQIMGGEVKFVLVNPVTTCPSADEHNDANLALVVRLCRTSYGEEFNPIKITMKRPIPKELDRYEKCFRVPVEYASTENSIVFNKSELEKELPTANAQLAFENDKIVAEYLSRYQRSNLTLQVRHKIIEQLASGKVSQESVAEALVTSLRNLQRNLKKEGASYKELLEDVRRELAAHYMEQSDMSINEITFLLGFSEPANFSRAFKRWTGVSPSEFRMLQSQMHKR